MKKQMILFSLFIILILTMLTGTVLATNGAVENEVTNETVQTTTSDDINEAKDYLSQLQPVHGEEEIENIKIKIAIVIAAITLAAIVILVMWKNEF